MLHSAEAWSGKTSEVPTFRLGLFGKMGPGIWLQSGTHFPLRACLGKRNPE